MLHNKNDKLLIFTILSCFFVNCLCAQTHPGEFSLLNNPDTLDIEKTHGKILAPYLIYLNLQEKENIMNKLPDTHYSLWENFKNNAEGIDSTFYTNLFFLDLDKDTQADIIMIPQIYFGPSLGFFIFGKDGDGYKYLYDNSGFFQQIKKEKEVFILQFQVLIIDNIEPQIIQNIVYSTKDKSYRTGAKLYYATQTALPKIAKKIKGFELKEKTELRFSPMTDDKVIEEKDDYYLTESKTIKGNVIAIFKTKSGGFILAEKGDWAFVVFRPDSNLEESSLAHGMDSSLYFDEETEEMKPDPNYQKPWLVGWLKKDVLIKPSK